MENEKTISEAQTVLRSLAKAIESNLRDYEDTYNVKVRNLIFVEHDLDGRLSKIEINCTL